MSTLFGQANLRKPTAKEKELLQRRLVRLERPGLSDHLSAVSQNLLAYKRPGGRLQEQGLRLRQGFSCLEVPIPGDASDRKAPPRQDRPPATRISSSIGSALRLELTVLSLLQIHRKPGARARLSDLGIPIAGHSSQTGWADLVGSLPPNTHGGRDYYASRDKRARTVGTALSTLQSAALVDLAGAPGKKNRYENFVPLQEVGAQWVGDREEYEIPALSDKSVFTLPAEFVLNGWLHVLEDSEVTALLMIACGAGAWRDGDLQVFSGEVRLRSYGIHRAPFSGARKSLESLGLIEVEEIDRHGDGRAEDNQQSVHRIGLRTSGFEEPALATAIEAMKQQLTR